ncbi:MAG TPA: copper chaperone [Pricia antarctica]|uniref:Copper chaperone n=2 Tax=root TaxID=1 RepID=A0A831VPY0_9FLAO|nr:copper chaperone [Pricia antarctica]
MKKPILFTLLLLFGTVLAHSQEKNKSVSFEVKGNCGMCKNRIETATIKMKGVKFAQWSPETKEFKAIIDERKCSVQDIQKKISEVGHDSDGFTAPEGVYAKLPECCKYRNPETTRMNHGNH